MIDSTARPATCHDPLEGKTAEGLIVTGVSVHRIAPEFQPAIDRAVAQVAAAGAGHSLYVYGSVATGMARIGHSDLDLVTVGLSPAMAGQIGRDLSAEFAHLFRGVEVGAAQPADLQGLSDESHGNRVFLRHYCAHLAGPDERLGLPDSPADRAAARGFNGDIGRCAERWRAELLRNPDPGPGPLGRRIARKTLLAAAGLVSLHDATWTTDRVLAAWRWGELRPELAGPLRALLAWSGERSMPSSVSEVQAVLDGVVADVVADFQRHIGLWA